MLARKLLATSLLGLGAATLLASPNAWSAHAGGHSGHGWPNSSMTCFQGSFSDMRNNCSTNQVLVLPVELPSFKTFATKVRVRGNGSSNATTCQVIRVDDNGSGFSPGTVSTISSSFTTLTTGNISVPSGALSFECQVAPVNGSNQGSVLWVDWN